MPNIKPISDLRNYTAVINEVGYGNRVYLTRNGHGQCAIIDMEELDELDELSEFFFLALAAAAAAASRSASSFARRASSSALDSACTYSVVNVT